MGEKLVVALFLHDTRALINKFLKGPRARYRARRSQQRVLWEAVVPRRSALKADRERDIPAVIFQMQFTSAKRIATAVAARAN